MPFRQKNHQLSMRLLLQALVAIIVFFLLLTSVISLAEKHIAIRRRIGELKEEETTLQAKQASLSAMNARLATPEGQEQAIRDKYNLVRPGEGLIVLTDKNEPEPVPERKNTVSRWWDALLHGLGIRKD